MARRIRTELMPTVIVFVLALTGMVRAQTCGSDYVVQEGDSLAKIATKVYGKASEWTLIFYANQDRLGGAQSLLVPGLSIRIPCLDNQTPQLPPAATTEAQAPKPTPLIVSPEVRRIQFLTADDYAPFTDRSLPAGGMATDIVVTAMNQFKKDANADMEFNVSWVNDWSAHLTPLLSTRAFDMGFPWAKPNCEQFEALDTNGKLRCQKFFFSEPIFEEQTLVFVRKDSPITMESDNELLGKKLCRPAGYSTYELDDNGRNWVKDKKVFLISPPSVEDCMRLLMDGSVDAIPINELTGRAAVVKLDLTDKIRVIDKPLALTTLHVIIAKTHPNARIMLYYVNSALERLHTSGEYDRIVERHLQSFWDSQAEQAKPKAPATTSSTTTDSGTTSANKSGTAAQPKTGDTSKPGADTSTAAAAGSGTKQ
jgi:polar amino acid transport system substrate-binding protein